MQLRSITLSNPLKGKSTLSSIGFFKRSFSKINDAKLSVRMVPDISYVGAKVLVPISFARYNLGDAETQRYDRDLRLIFKSLNEKFKTGEIADVDVLLTGGLQEINWPKSLCDSIETHFLSTHEKSLSKLSNYYFWDQFIDEVLGRDKFETTLSDIHQKSKDGSPWQNLMRETHRNLNLTGSIEDSIKYQRAEYALIASSSGLYTHIPYFGKLSNAWSYLTVAFPDLKIPCFSRIQLIKDLGISSQSDANQTVLLISSMLEQTISSPNFPKKEKAKLFELMENLVRAYMPEEILKREEKSQTISNVESSFKK